MVPGNNHTRSLVLYVAIEAVGWVTVALGFLSAGAGLLSAPAEGSVLPFNIGAATPGVTLAVAGLFAAGLAHHGRIAIEMARGLGIWSISPRPAQKSSPWSKRRCRHRWSRRPSLRYPPRWSLRRGRPSPFPPPNPIRPRCLRSSRSRTSPPTLPPADLIIPPLPPLAPRTRTGTHAADTAFCGLSTRA